MRRLIILFSLCFRFHSLLAYSIPSLSGMTLEDKIGQMLIVQFQGEEANDEARSLIRQARVGGFIYYNWSNGLTDPQQVQKLSCGLQKIAKEMKNGIPLFIATDQEGGRVTRLKKGFTQFPGNYALGQTKRSALAFDAAFAMAQEMDAVGINLNFGPDIDINSNPRNPVIGIRSFSAKPKVVEEFGERVLAAFLQAGVISSLKHFPGHGDVEVDSHLSLPVVNKSREELVKEDWLPFRRLARQAPMIMTAHLIETAIDPKNPVTFSRAVVEGMLRNEFGFRGLIITDSLVMQGLLDYCPSINEAALRSLQAGHDIVLLGGRQLLEGQKNFEISAEEVISLHHYLVSAVRQGKLSEKQVNQSVEKILKVKQDYGLFQKNLSKPASLANVNSLPHRQLAKEIAELALQVEGTVPIPFDGKSVAVIAPELLKSDVEQLNYPGKNVDIHFYFYEAPHFPDIKEADQYILFSNSSWKNQSLLDFLSTLLNSDIESTLILTGDPLDGEVLPQECRRIYTGSPAPVSLQVAIDRLMKPSNSRIK